MNEVRHELVEMFEGMVITDAGIRIIKPELFTGVNDTQSKLEYVLVRLTNNLIFNAEALRG